MKDNKNDETKNTNALESSKYTVALQILIQEGQLYWQTFGAFLLAHTVFLAFLLQSLSTTPATAWRPGAFVAAILGSLLCVPWLAALLRSSANHKFRMAQAKSTEPRGWNLLAKDGESFAEGNSVIISGKTYRIPWLSRLLRTTLSAKILIAFFAVAYLIAVYLSGPWCTSAEQSKSVEATTPYSERSKIPMIGPQKRQQASPAERIPTQ